MQVISGGGGRGLPAQPKWATITTLIVEPNWQALAVLRVLAIAAFVGLVSQPIVPRCQAYIRCNMGMDHW